MNPNVLLINPWIHDFAAVNMWARPLGLFKVAEYLSQFNCNLHLIDCLDDYIADKKFLYRYPKQLIKQPESLIDFPRKFYQYGISENHFIDQLKKLKPDIILVTCIMTYWYTGTNKVIEMCKQYHPEVPIILGGIYSKLFPDHAKQVTAADHVYKGDSNDDLKQVIESCNITLNRNQPSSAWYNLDFYDNMPYAPLLTTDGCPYTCPYCACSYLHPQFHLLDADQAINDIKILANRGVQDFAFYDDALLYKSDSHLDKILTAIEPIARTLRFHTPNGLHAKYMTAQTARLMKATNFETIRLSLETVNQKRQIETGNKIQNAQFSQAVTYLKEAGFKKHQIGVYLMYGLPDQPLEELWGGVRFLESLGVRIHFTELSPLPHTSTWQMLIDQKIITEDIDPLLTNNTVFASQYTNFKWDEIRKLREEVSRINQRDGYL